MNDNSQIFEQVKNPDWMVLCIEIRQVIVGHSSGPAGLMARDKVERLLFAATDIPAARSRDPFLFSEMRAMALEWTRRVEDADRARLDAPLVTLCATLLSAGRGGANPDPRIVD